MAGKQIQSQIKVAIGNEIGKGSYGTVYEKCKKTHSDEAVSVIKTLNIKDSMPEVNAGNSIATHPNISKLEEVFFIKEGGVDLCLLSYPMMSSDLSVLINGYIKDFNVILPIIFQLCSAVKEIHQSGFIHGDLKPQNILYNNATNCIKISDFGSCTYWIPGMSKKLSERFAFTLEYRPPLSSMGYTTSLDVWAIAIIILELICSRQYIILYLLQFIYITVPQINIRNQDDIQETINAFLSIKDTLALKKPDALSIENLVNSIRGRSGDIPNGLYPIISDMLNPNETDRPTMHDVFEKLFDLNRSNLICPTIVGHKCSSYITVKEHITIEDKDSKNTFIDLNVILNKNKLEKRIITQNKVHDYLLNISDNFVKPLPVFIFFNAIWIVDRLYTLNIEPSEHDEKTIAKLSVLVYGGGDFKSNADIATISIFLSTTTPATSATEKVIDLIIKLNGFISNTYIFRSISEEITNMNLDEQDKNFVLDNFYRTLLSKEFYEIYTSVHYKKNIKSIILKIIKERRQQHVSSSEDVIMT